MNKTQQKLKRGQKVKVMFEGVVINAIKDFEANMVGSAHIDGYRISVKIPQMKNSWWAVVPKEAVRIK